MSKNGKRTVTLEVAGTKVHMSSGTDEAHLQALASLVNDRVAALKPKAPRHWSTAELLAIIALDLADDLVTAEDRLRDLEELTRRTVEDAIARIDRRLAVADAR